MNTTHTFKFKALANLPQPAAHEWRYAVCIFKTTEARFTAKWSGGLKTFITLEEARQRLQKLATSHPKHHVKLTLTAPAREAVILMAEPASKAKAKASAPVNPLNYQARKATHTGTCQACGSRQKLPNGKLSLHGYTTEHGFFEGVCMGAGHDPLEVGKDILEASIIAARNTAEGFRKTLAALQQPATSTEDVWARVYVSGQGYQWVTGNIVNIEGVWKLECFGKTLMLNEPRYLTALEVADSLNGLRASDIKRRLTACEAYQQNQTAKAAAWQQDFSGLKLVTR